jgi:hypothetical protein
MRRARFLATAATGSGKLELQGETEADVRAGITRMEPLIDPGAWKITDRETKHDGTTEATERPGDPEQAADPAAGGHEPEPALAGHRPDGTRSS